MFLPAETLEDRSNLILVNETIEKFGYDPNNLGRHSKYLVVFKCIVCGLPSENTKKMILDRKGLTHLGECRHTLRLAKSRQARAIEDPQHKQARIQKLRERLAKDGAEVVRKRQATLIERYGSKNLSEIESIRDNISKGIKKAFAEKDVVKKRQQTNLTKYGSTNFLASDEGRLLVKEANQSRLGVDFPFQNKEFQAKAREAYVSKSGFKNPSEDIQINQKRRETNLQRYGVANPIQNHEVQERREKTNIEKYGYPQASRSTEVRKKIGISLSTGELISDIYRKYAVPPCTAQKVLKEYGEQAFWDFCKNYSGPPLSSLEQRFIRIMETDITLSHYNKNPIEFSTTSKPDFRCQSSFRLIYINVDGLYWHSEHCINNPHYHSDLNKVYKQNGIRLMQFREDEVRLLPEVVKSIVLNSLGLHKRKLHARRCNINIVPYQEARSFFKENHLMGYSAATTFGLYSNGELVSAIAIKRKEEGIEIARFGSKNFCNIRGGFSKLLKFVIKKYNPKKIISFCDLRYADGHSYEKLGFKLESISQGWQWTDFQNTFNRRKCRANMDERGLSEREYADEKGWAKIYDAGQAKYVLEDPSKLLV
jgi:hypothetical protein